ncbi:MAG: hypothetical protein BWY06_00618 [Candidatus Latescibacteria bacterium ADurb.Bin168]|nr:MAG: hypothetical protein BWY06_00618 [Candidatus Latescibacteria bacterium ADurb.Bin168]
MEVVSADSVLVGVSGVFAGAARARRSRYPPPPEVGEKK